MAESIPEKDQFLIAYPNYVLRETVTYPNGGVSRFYDDGVDMVIIDDEICSCRDGEQIFPYTLITDKQNHYMKIYRRVFRFLGFDPETIEKCLQKSRQEVLHFSKKISERGEHADSSPLELLFEQNFTDVYGMRALKYLQKEFRISDEDGNNYFLDYLIDTADSRVAIEENGIHYHHPQLIGIEGYRKQLRKQNTCALWGLKLYRFSTEDCRFKDRIEDDIRSYLGKDTSGFREAGLLLERKTELYEHQEISLAQIQERREKGIRAFLIVLPTAAGKSRIVEEDIQKFAAGKEQFRALILAPNTNIIADWKERIDKDLQPLQDRIDIKTYSYAVRHYHEKPRDYYSYIVVDEAHKAKNSSGGVIAQAVLELAKYSSARVVLTGTPAPNGYEDIYNMFKFIWPTKNIIGFEINQLRDITAMGDRARIERLISNISPFFIRIRKSDLNIPPATINPPIVVPMGEYQRRIYDFIEKKYMDEMIGEGEPDLSSKFKIALAHARMIRLMQAASDPAMLRTPLNEFLEDDECPLEAYQAIDDADVLKAIIEYEAIETPSKFLAVEKIVRQIIEDGGKVVIWATFIHTIHSIKEYLESKGIQCQELYGAIPVEKEGTIDDGEEQILTREKIVRAFQDDNCPFKVIIANPFAVAESISLHKACHNAIYLERSFNAAHFVQSKDRIHRYGLKEGTKTNYYYILSEDSIDETIDARLAEKEHRMNEIMESMPIPLFDNASDDLGDEDIKALIKDYVRRTKKI